MPIYQSGPVQVHYEEAGSGFPLLVIPGGGLNATIAGLANHAFNPLEVFSDTYRVIALDLRNANGGESKGPLEIERTWDAFTDDELGLMDHLGIDRFMVLGFCIGGQRVDRKLLWRGATVMYAILSAGVPWLLNENSTNAVADPTGYSCPLSWTLIEARCYRLVAADEPARWLTQPAAASG